MITYIREKAHYEDLYDKQTVEIGRREANSIIGAMESFNDKAKLTDQKEIEAMEFWWERIYWWLIEIPILLPRWEERDQVISGWIAQDRALDDRLANARPHIEPTCSHCNQHGLRLINKQFLHRGGKQEVLFMFGCPVCDKRSAYWEDGVEWESLPSPCPKCRHDMTITATNRGKTLTTISTCPACGHSEVEKMRIGEETKEQLDPYYERDKEFFCLSDERAHIMQGYRIKWQDAMRMLDEEMEKKEKQEVYHAVSQLQTLKVIDLIEILKPAIEAAGFIEVRFEKPDFGLAFNVEFNCLDKHSARTDAKSRAALKRAVVKTLAPTNWRLMSEGISYRLGYLSGRVRVYENEKDLAALVERETAKNKEHSK